MNICRLWLVSFFAGLLLSASAGAVQREVAAGTGLDQRVGTGAQVVMMGAGWSTVGRVVRFRWHQIDGPRIRLRNANHSTATFIAPQVSSTTVLKFRLTVTDTRGRTASSTVNITVDPRVKDQVSEMSDKLQAQTR